MGLSCPNKSSTLYKTLKKLNKDNENLATYQYDYVYKLQDDGILSLKRFKPDSGKLEYSIPKVVTEKSISKSFTGDSPYAKNIRAFEELDKRITLDDIDWIVVKETKNAYMVEILPPVKETPKPGIQTKLFSFSNVNYQFKAVEKILANIAKVKQWEKVVTNPPMIWEKIQKDFQIPKDQLELLKNSKGNTVSEKLINFSADYSYTIEINTAKTQDKSKTQDNIFTVNNNNYELKYKPETGNKYFKNNKEINENEFTKANNEYVNSLPTQYYSNLTVPGGTNYTENEIATPLITPSIKGHAQFATSNGLGHIRMDERVTYVDSDTENLIEIMKKSGVLKINCA
jgi:hypothetical protein